MHSKVVAFIILVVLQYAELLDTDPHYTNTWAVEIPGGFDVAKRVANDHGYEIVRQVRCVLLLI